jgi:hypothetical protein
MKIAITIAVISVVAFLGVNFIAGDEGAPQNPPAAAQAEPPKPETFIERIEKMPKTVARVEEMRNTVNANTADFSQVSGWLEQQKCEPDERLEPFDTRVIAIRFLSAARWWPAGRIFIRDIGWHRHVVHVRMMSERFPLSPFFPCVEALCGMRGYELPVAKAILDNRTDIDRQLLCIVLLEQSGRNKDEAKRLITFCANDKKELADAVKYACDFIDKYDMKTWNPYECKDFEPGTPRTEDDLPKKPETPASPSDGQPGATPGPGLMVGDEAQPGNVEKNQVPVVLEIPDFTGKVAHEQLDATVNKIVEQYYGTGDILISQLHNKDVPDNNKVYIIYLLGTYRDPRAVEALLDNIDFVAPWVDPKLRLGRWGPHPAMETLVHFGKKASFGCLERLAKGESKATKIENFYMGGQFTTRELYLEVFKDVEGNDVAKFMLQNAIDKEQDKDKKANLTAALDTLGKWIDKEEEWKKQQEEKEKAGTPEGNPPTSGGGNP